MDKEECMKYVLGVFPEYQSLYQSHMDDYGEILLHVFIAEAINEPLIILLKNGSDTTVYCEVIETMWRSGNEEVRNVVDVTILERLSDDEHIWQQFGKKISSEFRDYINNDLLTYNLMMSGVKKLNS